LRRENFKFQSILQILLFSSALKTNFGTWFLFTTEEKMKVVVFPEFETPMMMGLAEAAV